MSDDKEPKIEVKQNVDYSGFLILGLIFLFWGDPDIHDMLMKILEKLSR